MPKVRYPSLNIRSKNELAKQISGAKFSHTEALELINDVLVNFDKYWKDNEKKSEPKEKKFVRSAWGTPLGKLLKKIDKEVLAPQDKFLPGFIFGGIKGKNHVKAARSLLGKKRKRTLLKLDITRFFEQISQERVFNLYSNRFRCTKRAAKLLSSFSCVPEGKKGDGVTHKTIARGFATSSRLAVWSNLDVFLKIDLVVKEKLKGKDPRIAVYVDDIGITATKTSIEEMKVLADIIKEILLNFDPNQPLPLKDKKTKIRLYNDKKGLEHLGIKLERNKLRIGGKARSKKDRLKKQLNNKLSKNDRSFLKNKEKGMRKYVGYVEKS